MMIKQHDGGVHHVCKSQLQYSADFYNSLHTDLQASIAGTIKVRYFELNFKRKFHAKM